MDTTSQADMFGPDQGDLFGSVAPKFYVPKPEHVRNRLASLLGEMETSDAWPWSPAMVRLHRNQTFEYLCGLLPDLNEAQEWRARIAKQIERLDAAKGDCTP